MLPPIWQDPSAPRLRGKRRSARSAAFWISFRTTPASTVIVSLTVSIARTSLMREVETTISLMSACGTLPPVSPVLPPWGTMPTPASAQMRTTAGDLRRRLRLQDERHAALPVVAEALAVGRHVDGIVDAPGGPNGGLQALDHVGRDGLGCAYAGHVGNPHWARRQHRSGWPRTLATAPLERQAAGPRAAARDFSRPFTAALQLVTVCHACARQPLRKRKPRHIRDTSDAKLATNTGKLLILNSKPTTGEKP